jgi:hypothetical protein
MIRHRTLSGLLTLILMLGIALSAQARPPVTPGLQVELCTDAGPVLVTLDQDGRPTPTHAPCALCLAAQDMALPVAPAACTAAPLRATRALRPVPPPPLTSPPRHRPAARAPPVPA